MHKVRVFFEQVVIPVVDTGVVALSEPDIKIANAFEQLRGNVILLAFYLRGLGLGVVVHTASARIVRARDAQLVEELVVVDVFHPTWPIDVAAVRDPVEAANRGIVLFHVVTDKLELPRNALTLIFLWQILLLSWSSPFDSIARYLMSFFSVSFSTVRSRMI